MRELAVTLRFTSHCLGKIPKYHRQNGKPQQYYVLPRDPSSGRVIFQRQWWLATLRKAAEILCRHQQDISKIQFAIEIEGEPQPIPGRFYKRQIDSRRYSKHEAYFPGDTITTKCVVPRSISNEDFLLLMQYAGRYCGMSPGHPGDFGFYDVVSIEPTLPTKQMELEQWDTQPILKDNLS